MNKIKLFTFALALTVWTAQGFAGGNESKPADDLGDIAMGFELDEARAKNLRLRLAGVVEHLRAEAEAGRLEDAVTHLESSMAKLKEGIAHERGHSAAVRILSDVRAEHLDAAHEELETVQAKLGDVQVELARTKQALDASSGQNEDLQSQLSDLESEYAALESKYALLESERDEQRSSKAMLLARMTINTLSDKADDEAHQTQEALSQVKIRELEAEVSRLKDSTPPPVAVLPQDVPQGRIMTSYGSFALGASHAFPVVTGYPGCLPGPVYSQGFICDSSGVVYSCLL